MGFKCGVRKIGAAPIVKPGFHGRMVIIESFNHRLLYELLNRELLDIFLAIRVLVEPRRQTKTGFAHHA